MWTVRSCDLRAARLELRANVDDIQLALTATDQRSGKSLRLPIRQDGRFLPASELTALAEAILAEPGLLRRTGDDQVAAMTVAGRLREFAVADTRTR